MVENSESRNLLVYWRNSLVDGYRLQELEHAVEVAKDALKTGEIGSKKADELKARFKEAQRTTMERGKESSKPQDALPVLVCPVKLVKKHNHYQENTAGGDKELIPLWIPALLDKSGKLQPREDHLPWIARGILEPTTKRGVTIGDIEDIENFLSGHNHDKVWENWSSLWDYAHAMLKAMPEGELALSGYVISGQSYIMPDVEVRGAAMSAIMALDHIIESKTIPPLLERYASLGDAPEKPILIGEERIGSALKHNGQMGCEFPLSVSQRTALHHFLQIGHGDILAVNGPPGTGKTTLMHSAIASIWVEAVVKQSSPPVIVAVSANNQAVTNMIDSFSKVAGENEEVLSGRWIPGIKSYGLYCPSGSASQRTESDKYQKATPGDNNFPAKNGFPGIIESPDYINQAEKYYLERASEYTGKPISTVKEAVSLVHRDLITNIEETYTELSKYQDQHKALVRAGKIFSEVTVKYGLEAEGNILESMKALRVKYDGEQLKLQEELTVAKEEFDVVSVRHVEVLNLVKEIKPPNTGLLGKIIAIFGGQKKEPVIPGALQKMLDHHETEIAANSTRQKQITDLLVKKGAQVETLNAEIATLEQVSAVAESGGLESLRDLQERHDTQNRYKSFLMATHYWEGRWLIEVRKMQEMAARKTYLPPEERVAAKWRRYAMLTPVIVSTLYIAPRLFTAWHREGEYLYPKPLLEYIDLLVVDEAGQATPELAAATFALAKKAVVVGDVLQIEPVYNITKYVDQGNLIRHGLIESRDEYPMVQAKGVTASGGSVMAVAQRACPYWPADESGEKYPDRGMFLSEHRRCLDGIISYCNELAYSGRLCPMRGNEISPGALAQFSYLHISGKSIKVGSSRKNEKEALAILDWLLLNKEYIQAKYGTGEKPFKDLVAVLTPFTAQKKTFLRTLWGNKKYDALRGITFGTIHALQGSERDVVIFSPVYTREDGDPGEFFFNSDIRMLNVAVSRARESFVVMGDMEVFKKSGGPAGLLAKYLFAEDANNLAGA